MPNKTIYVSDRDLALFDRAQALAGGNLSAAISQALTRYVEIGEAADAGMHEVIVQVGPSGMRQRKRFVGAAVAHHQRKGGRRSIFERYIAYRTARGSYAVHVRRDWSPVPIPFDVDYDVGVPGRPGADESDRDYTLDVYPDVDALCAAVPRELCTMVRTHSRTPTVEDLDI